MAHRTIGLLNTMPDAAMRHTETQFRDLLGPGVTLKLFCLPEIRREGLALQQMQASHQPFESLADAGLDGLIVTGMEPRAAHLRDEPFWASLAAVIDWTCKDAVPTIWSCLSAHAAVLHLSGIERRRCARKRSGLYRCVAAASGHRWSQGLPQSWLTPHSRHNTVAEADLRRLGYMVLSRAHSSHGGASQAGAYQAGLPPEQEIGVDAFAAGDLPFLFLQGHPEYDGRALLREYVRDVLRADTGNPDRYPSVPENYLDEASSAAFLRLRQRALADPSARLHAEFGQAVRDVRLLRQPRPAAHSLVGNWLAALPPGIVAKPNATRPAAML